MPISRASGCPTGMLRMADSERPSRRKLQVANARPEDSGRGLAHLPRALMAALGIDRRRRDRDRRQAHPPRRARSVPIPRTRGSSCSGSTGCSAPMPASARAISSRCARPNSKPATRVVFAPAQQNLRLQGSAKALKRTFFGRPLCAGDIVATAGQQRVDGHAARRPAACCNAPAYALQEIRLAVVSTSAQGHRPHRREYRDRAAPRI